MNNKKISTLTIITCLTMLITSNLIAMDESRKRSRQDSDDNIEESHPLKRQALEIECVICREPVEELAPQQHTHQERGMRLGCIPGENNHYFHTGCLNSWLTGTTKAQSQCPSCKQYLIVPQIDFEEIFDAIDNNNLDLLQTLIEPATINVGDEESNMTALDYAALNGKYAIVEFLLTNSANPNFQYIIAGETALHRAAEKGHQAIVELLLANDANPNLQNRSNKTSLHLAAEYKNQSIVELLLANGANPNMQDWNGWTALHYAAAKSNQDIIKILLTRGANINIQNKNGGTVLHIAAYHGKSEIIKFLLTQNPTIDTQDRQNKTALHYATSNVIPQSVQDLLENGANPNVQDRDGNTALHLITFNEFALQSSKRKIIKLLLTHGANVNLRNNGGNNALQLATATNNQDTINTINSHRSFPVYALLKKQFPSATITQENNTLTVNNITVKFSYDTDKYNPFTDDNYHTIDIMVGDNTEPLKTYLTQALGSTTHRLGMLGTCWHLGISNWQLTYRDASSWYSNYSSHADIKPNRPLRFYLSAPDDADFKTYINFCVGLVAATEGLTHE